MPRGGVRTAMPPGGVLGAAGRRIGPPIPAPVAVRDTYGGLLTVVARFGCTPTIVDVRLRISGCMSSVSIFSVASSDGDAIAMTRPSDGFGATAGRIGARGT